MNKKILFGIVILLLIIVGVVLVFFYQTSTKSTVTQKPTKGILIGFAMGTLQEERWQRDRDEFVKRAGEVGAVVDVQSSENNTDKQISQIESMIVKGVDVLVIVPNDANSLTGVINDAHKAGIKVLSYDRLITNANVDLYVSFDSEKVGEYQAQSILDSVASKLGKGTKLKFAYIGGSPTDNNAFLVKSGAFKILQPEIDKGNIDVVLDKFSDNWDPENAYKNLKAYLSQPQASVDAVVAANDGTAFGVIKALDEHGLAGKVPVSGQDAELSALQRIIQGTQTSTVYKPIAKLADTAVDLAVSLANNEKISANTTTNNGLINVPSVLLESVLVTKDNIKDTVIKDGYYKLQDVYNQ